MIFRAYGDIAFHSDKRSGRFIAFRPTLVSLVVSLTYNGKRRLGVYPKLPIHTPWRPQDRLERSIDITEVMINALVIAKRDKIEIDHVIIMGRNANNTPRREITPLLVAALPHRIPLGEHYEKDHALGVPNQNKVAARHSANKDDARNERIRGETAHIRNFPISMYMNIDPPATKRNLSTECVRISLLRPMVDWNSHAFPPRR